MNLFNVRPCTRRLGVGECENNAGNCHCGQHARTKKCRLESADRIKSEECWTNRNNALLGQFHDSSMLGVKAEDERRSNVSKREEQRHLRFELMGLNYKEHQTSAKCPGIPSWHINPSQNAAGRGKSGTPPRKMPRTRSLSVMQIWIDYVYFLYYISLFWSQKQSQICRVIGKKWNLH